MSDRLVVTMGEPAGVGGELTLKAWQARSKQSPRFVVVDNLGRLAAIDPSVPIQSVHDIDQAMAVFDEALPVIDVPLALPPQAGQPASENAPAVIASIERAVQLVLAGQAGAVVTNPIQKDALYAAGFTRPGHTEFLADLTQAQNPPVMMLACEGLRVVPVTIHVSLRTALDQLSTELVVEQARLTHAALRNDFGIPEPRMAVAGLNPHAGEAGAMGEEETAIIQPAIDALRADGLNVVGPVPPDTLFSAQRRPTYDAAICMYHDQALIPIKTLDFAGGVNITLGLPIVRTSPDHGTALDIAGTGKADPNSLLAAMDMAAMLARNRHDAG